MRVTPAVSVLMLALAMPAQAADKYAWDFVKSGQEVQLAYGIPESEAVIISFMCKAKRIEIISTVLPRKPRKGRLVKTTLSNGAVTTAFDGKFGHTSSEEGFYFQASVAAEPKVVAVLKSGTSLTIDILGKQERVPLKGVAAPLAQFEAACFRSR
jgi:hypothetical protein